MMKKGIDILPYNLDDFSKLYLYSCAGLCVDDKGFTIKNSAGSDVQIFGNNTFRKMKLFSFHHSCNRSSQRKIMVALGDVCPLLPYSDRTDGIGTEWCMTMVNQGMQRFYHMVVFALLLDGKRRTVQIPGVPPGCFSDDQTKIFFAEKLPLLQLGNPISFIHSSNDLKEPYFKKYNHNFVSELCRVSEFLISSIRFADPVIDKDKTLHPLEDTPECHANKILLNCQLAAGLQSFLREHYNYDNQADKLNRYSYSNKINEYVNCAVHLFSELKNPQVSEQKSESLLNSDCDSYRQCKYYVLKLQEIHQASFQSISDLINSERDDIHASLLRFFRLAQDRLREASPARASGIDNNQIINQPQQPYISTNMPPWQLSASPLQTPYGQPATQQYQPSHYPYTYYAQQPFGANNPYSPQVPQIMLNNLPENVLVNSYDLIPPVQRQRPFLKKRSERYIPEIINGLQENKFLNKMPFQKNEQYEQDVLLLYRAEFELFKSVYRPEKSHSFHLDSLHIQVYDNQFGWNKEFAAKDFANALLSSQNIQVKTTHDQRITLDINSVSKSLGYDRSLALLIIYAYIHGKTDLLQCAHEIANQTNIPTDIAKLSIQSPLYESGDFSEAIEDSVHTDDSCIKFTGENNAVFYKVVSQFIPSGNNSPILVTLPLIYASKTNQQYHKPFLLPPKTHRLFGLTDLLNYKDVPIFLTEHLEIASCFSNLPDANFVSWWGHNHTLESVDFSPLNGKTVYYLLFDPSQMLTAIKVCRKIKDGNGTPNIIDCRRGINQNTGLFNNLHIEETEIYVEDRFVYLADKIGYNGKMLDFINTIPFKAEGKIDLVNGIFKTKEFIVVYGKEKSGKTYVSLSIALGIASKKAPHELWEINQEIEAGVMYCHGEMTDSEIQERIDDIKIKMGIDKEKLNFKSLNLQDEGMFDLTDPNNQEQLIYEVKEFRKNKKINQMAIVLDNYSCLMGTGSQQGDVFNSAYALILKLQSEYDCCVILVCHDNAEGNVASSRQILRKVDGVIKVSKFAEWKEAIRKAFFSKVSVKIKNFVDFETIENELMKEFVEPKDTLESHIDYQNFRHLGKQEPFSMTFTFDHQCNGQYAWKIEKADKEQYIKDLVELYSDKKPFPKIKDGLQSDNSTKKPKQEFSFAQLQVMNQDQIKEAIKQIGSNLKVGKLLHY